MLGVKNDRNTIKGKYYKKLKSKIPKDINEIEKTKLNIQLALGILLVVAGLVLLFCGFWTVPIGEIANSVLVAYGEVSTFAGALIGVDYSYKFRKFKIEEEEKTKRNKKEQDQKEDKELEYNYEKTLINE